MTAVKWGMDTAGGSQPLHISLGTPYSGRYSIHWWGSLLTEALNDLNLYKSYTLPIRSSNIMTYCAELCQRKRLIVCPSLSK